MKRFIVVTVALIWTTVQGGFNDNSEPKKRQSLLLCVSTLYVSLSGEERECLPNLNGVAETSSLSMDMFEKLCSSETCIRTIKRFLQECKSSIEAQLPSEYQDVDIESFFDLFCTNASNGTFCYSKLPLFNNSTADPIQSCPNVLNGETCSNDCQQALQLYTSTCCFASYLELLPNQYGVQPTDLWSRCNMSSPSTCDALINASSTAGTDSPVITDPPPHKPPSTGSPSGPAATNDPATSDGNDNEPIKHGDDEDGSNSHSDDDKGPAVIGVTVAAVMVTMILIVAVPATLVTLFLYFKRKRGIRRLSTANSGDVMRMSLANNEDPDD